MSPHKTNKNMETSFKQTTSNKVERYRLFLPQFELLISDEKEEEEMTQDRSSLIFIDKYRFICIPYYSF